MIYKYPHRNVCKVVAKSLKFGDFLLILSELTQSVRNTNGCCCKQGVCWT